MKDNIFQKAFWESPRTALVFLTQDWANEHLRLPLSLAPDQIHFAIEREEPMKIAMFAGYCVLGDKIRFVVDPSKHPTLNRGEKLYVGGLFNGWQEAIGKSEFELREVCYKDILLYQLDLPVSIMNGDFTSYFRFVTENHNWLNVPEFAPNLVPNRYQGSDFMLNLRQSGEHVFKITIEQEIQLHNHMDLTWRDPHFEETIPISNAEFYLSMESDKPMGVTQEKHRWTFRIFAPRASRVTLELFKTFKKTDVQKHDLSKNDDGSWEITLKGNWKQYFYYYYIDGINYDGSTSFDYAFPVVDPYAMAMASSKGPGIVLSQKHFKPLADGFHPPLWHDLVMVEVHLRDILKNTSMDLARTERNHFTGMAKWLRDEGNYLKKLGVNAIEFQPLHEFEYENKEEYHWGYMPVNYFSPASCNEKYPKSGNQTENFKDMVKACHEAGFAFILDVVYNHLGSPNPLNAIDKHYYFELDSNYNMSNWSGVGNDIHSSSPMAKRLIIDSLKHYAINYGVDGFRFDLAELIDIGVLAEIEMELKKVKPSVILIAEPWSFKGHIGEKLKSTGFSSWNDSYRNFFIEYLRGSGSPRTFEYFLKGSPNSLTRFPAQTVNYSESHDDYSWLDLITENPERDGSNPTTNDLRRAHLMFSMLFISLGIPMISEGQDFMRSKRGIRNTYQRGDINALDYQRVVSYSFTHDYVRNWIRFRLSRDGHLLRLEFHPEKGYFDFVFNDDKRSLAVCINADQSKGSERLIYAINPSDKVAEISHDAFHDSSLKQIADTFRFDMNGLTSALTPIKGDSIKLQPLSCALWSFNK